MAEKISFLVKAQYCITRCGENIINEDNKRNPRVFFLNQYFYFSFEAGFEEARRRILKTLRSRVALHFGKGCKITLISDIKMKRQERKTKKISGQMLLFA